MKPTMDDVMERIRRLAPNERLRLISELEKHKVEIGHTASVEHVADVLPMFGLVEAKTIEVGHRTKRSTRT